jgi:transposase InsO family protein
MSERRACRVISADRKSMRYRSCRADDGDLRSRLRELAGQRRRFGYRRLHILLRRDGITINRKKTQRLYREEGLTVRRRKGRRRAVGARALALALELASAGAWTSSTTSSLPVVDSASSTSSMM